MRDEPFDRIPTNLFPPSDGQYSIEFGRPVSLEVARVFDLDDGFASYRAAKERARSEDLTKYYCTDDYPGEIANRIAGFIVSRLVSEWPAEFRLEDRGSGRQDLYCRRTGEVLRFGSDMVFDGVIGCVNSPPVDDALDALAMQVQEDFVIARRSAERGDWLAAIHLCLPNHWRPCDKIGRSFDDVHAPVAGMQGWRSRATRLLDSMLDQGPFERFAWGISTEAELNRHPDPPEGISERDWHDDPFDPSSPRLVMRIERQILIGFPAVETVLFTIRTHFRDLAEVRDNPELCRALKSALRSMSADTLEYKRLADSKDAILGWLDASG